MRPLPILVFGTFATAVFAMTIFAMTIFLILGGR